MIKDLIEQKPQAKTIMGIDASSKAVAYSIFESGKLVNYGKIYISGDDVYERCGDVNKKMYALLKLYEPDFVAIEAAVYVNNRQVVIDLAKVYGAMIGVIKAMGIECDEVYPTTWMSHIGNPARDSKETKQAVRKEFPGESKSWYKRKLRERRKQRTLDWVEEEFGAKVTDDDVGDSIAIGFYTLEELVDICDNGS